MKGSSIVNSKRARPTELRGELVNKSCKEEPVCLKCNKGLVNADNRREPICLKCSEGLVYVSNWALGVVALVAFKPRGDVA